MLNPADVRLCPILPLPTFQPFQGKRKVRRSGPESGRSTAENDPEQKFVALQSRRLTSALIGGNKFSARSPYDDRRPVERELGVRSEYLSA